MMSVSSCFAAFLSVPIVLGTEEIVPASPNIRDATFILCDISGFFFFIALLADFKAKEAVCDAL